MRTPNTICEVCFTEFYKRPTQKEKSKINTCCIECRNIYRGISNKTRICVCCGKNFEAKSKTQKTCSKVCAGKFSRKPWNTAKNGSFRNKSEQNLIKLKTEFSFNSCMIEGCNYNKLFVIHRFIHGKDGGEYVIGNMFAICPNHHAEIHNKLIKVDKVNDHTLMIIEGYSSGDEDGLLNR